MDDQKTIKDRSTCIWWSLLPSAFLAFIWSANYMSRLAQGQANDALTKVLLAITFPIDFAIFFVLIWTPLLGVMLTIFTAFRLAQPSFIWKMWILFAILLFLFFGCYQILLTTPTMGTYRKLLYLEK